MYSVFISYSHADDILADNICCILDAVGVNYFRDVKQIEWGDGINERVREALLESQSVLVIISPASLKSLWVPFEIGSCSALNRKVLPYLQYPALDLPGYIAGIKHISKLEEVSEYFSRPAREWGTVYSNPPKNLPDVRVTYSPAISRNSKGEASTIVAISAANHDGMPVYMNNVSLMFNNEMRMRIVQDMLTGQSYSRKTLNPGERMDIRITREAFTSTGPLTLTGLIPNL